MKVSYSRVMLFASIPLILLSCQKLNTTKGGSAPSVPRPEVVLVVTQYDTASLTTTKGGSQPPAPRPNYNTVPGAGAEPPASRPDLEAVNPAYLNYVNSVDSGIIAKAKQDASYGTVRGGNRPSVPRP